MITFGIQGIRYYNEVNKEPHLLKEKATENWWTWNICNGLHYKLLKAGHSEKFYDGDKDCWAIHLNDPSLKAGGIDDNHADDVDLFFIYTHGNKYNDKPMLLYNVKKDDWLSYGIHWKLGNKRLKWLMLQSCSVINLKNVMACIDIFDGLHGICGAYDLTYPIEEGGRDLGEYLTDIDMTVADAWFEARSDFWSKDNHPIVVCANDKYAYTKGNLINFLSTINDYLTPSGFIAKEIPRSQIVGLHWVWVE